jgi:hypothetical protein
MAQDLRTINQVIASTRDAVRSELVDNFFTSNSLFARLYRKGKVVEAGGDEIRIPIIYDKAPGGYYSGLGPFAISQKETVGLMRFDWVSAYKSITLPGMDVFKNSGPHQIFDLVSSQLTVAQMSLADEVGTEMYNTGADLNKVVGLRLATLSTGTYGKITRGADALGTSVTGNIDTTGGAITVPFLNNLMGTASRGGARKPDLLITTQTLWDAVWAHIVPQQRFNAAEGPAWDVGVNYININGSTLVADNKCTSGYVFGLPTDFMEFYVGTGKDFTVRGPFELDDQDGFTAQVLLYHQLCLSAPNLSFAASGLTA